MINVSTVSNPSVEPVDTSAAKSYMRVDHGTDDTIISGLITGERQTVEDFCHRAMITQTKLYRADSITSDVRLPYGPVQSITSVATIDSAGSTSDVDASDYYQAGDRIHFTASPVEERSALGFEIKYKTGYSDASTGVPDALKTAVKEQVQAVYDGSAGEGVLTSTAERLAQTEKVYTL